MTIIVIGRHTMRAVTILELAASQVKSEFLQARDALEPIHTAVS